MKKLKSLKFHTSGGLCNERDLHGAALEFTISNNIIYCNVSLVIGNLFITKIFKNDEHKILNNVIDLLNTCNFDKLNTDYNRMALMDISDNIIEYSYEDYENLIKIKNPNSRDLLKLLNDFIMNYLLKDSELISIFNAIINNNLDMDYSSLKNIIKNDNVFGINNDYNLNELTENTVDILTEKKRYDSSNNISIDELISKIDKKIEDIDNL